MNLYTLSDTVFYLSLSLIVVFILIAFIILLMFYKRKTTKKFYSDVRGRVVLKGRVDYSGARITMGKLKSREKLLVSPLVNREGELMRTNSDKKGNFSFSGVPVGVYWLVIETKGYKTLLKAAKIERVEENILNDIVIK